MTEVVNVDSQVPNAQKDAGAKVTYGFDLDDILPTGDNLAAVTWSVTPAVSGGVSVLASSFTPRACQVTVENGVAGVWYAVVGAWTTVSGLAADQIVLRLFIKADAELLSGLGSALFPNRFTATAQLRRDQLMLAIGAKELADDYVWSKIVAAESEVAHTLRVPLVPTRFFPADPDQTEIDALAGMPWAIDPGYDLGPENNAGDRWGMLSLRNKPIISIDRYRFAYPSVTGLVYDMPLEWVRADKKYGIVNVVPTSLSASVPLSAIVMQALAGGRTVPLMLQVTYTAGLANAARDYPELLDAIKKLAVLKIIEDQFRPQSGSISADGLSQSVSVDMDKYRDTVDHILNGGKGSNGGLMTAIHGVRGMVY